MRLGYRYSKSTDCLHLSNGSLVNEQMLADSTVFGSYCSQLMFQFFRQLSSFGLSKVEFALLCAVVFFSSDRPMLIERNKVQSIQSKYIYLLKMCLYESEEDDFAQPGKSSISSIILSLLKLKALDSLSMFDS
jgi:hypothetical protein